MAETADQPPQRLSFRIKLAIAAVAAALFVGLFYFALSTAAFVRAVVLPRVGDALGATVQAEAITFKPFSGLVLRNVTAHTLGDEPLLVADELRLRYRLFPTLRGATTVEEFFLLSPVLQVVRQPDGTSNLDTVLEALEPEADPDTPTRLALRNIGIHNGTVRQVRRDPGGTEQVSELRQLNFALDRLENGQPGTVKLGAELFLETSAPAAEADRLLAVLNGAFQFQLSPLFTLELLEGTARLDVTRTEGLFGDLSGTSAVLEADLTPTEVRQVSLRLLRDQARLGHIQAAGPLDLARQEGRIRIDVQSIDRHLLNLAGGLYGYDFGATTFNATNVVDLARQGNLITLQGQLSGRDVALEQKGRRTPPLQLAFAYQLSLNLNDQTAVLQRLDLTAHENAREVARAGLDRPMHLTWGKVTRGFTDSTLTVELTELPLAPWAGLFGPPLESGLLSVKATVLAQEDGRLLTAKTSARLQDLTGSFNDLRLEQGDLQLDADLRVQELDVALVDPFQVRFVQGGAPVLSANGTARYDRSREELKVQLSGDGSLPHLAQWLPEQVEARAGSLRLSANLGARGERRSFTGNIGLSDFTGAVLDIPLEQFDTTLNLFLEQNQHQLRLHRAGLEFRQAFRPAGNLDFNGRWDTSTESGEFTFRASNLNHHLLQPVLSSLPGGLTLETVQIGGTGSLQHRGPEGRSSLTAEITGADLRWAPGAVPLAGQLVLDTALDAERFELNQFRASFLSGEEPAGAAELTAQVQRSGPSVEAAFKLDGFNEHLLGPWLAPHLGENQLASIALNGQGKLSHAGRTHSALEATLALSNLRVRDPDGQLSDPLETRLALEGTVRDQLLELSRCVLSLSPTPRARNELALEGKLDLDAERQQPGHLLFRSESLDFTPFYNLLGSAENGAPAPAPPPAEEARPVSPPFQPLRIDLDLGTVYLRDLELGGFRTTLTLEDDLLRTPQPLNLTLNGAPVQADASVNLALPGYAFQISLDADRVPIQPLAASFSTGPPGRYRGDLVARARIQGQGTTGPSLRRHLDGEFSLSLTNLNLEVAGPRLRQLLEPVALVLRVPELTQTPINWVNAQARIAQGQVQLDQFAALSHAFVAEGRGVVQLADVLTNSPVNIPLSLSLRRSLAQKARLIDAQAHPDAVYVELPRFVRISGTAGDPRSDIDKTAISALLLRAASRIPQLGDRTGEFLQDLGELLAPQRPPQDPAQPDPPPRRSLFDLLRPPEPPPEKKPDQD